MNNETLKRELIIALNTVQTQLNAPKTRVNSYSKYKYRNCDDIVEAAKKVMPGNCALILSDDVWLVGDRFYIKATATFICESESISVTAYAREPLEKKGSDECQITGATSSYARKYALNGLFAIDDSDDSDSHDNRDEPKKAQSNTSKFSNSVVTSMKPATNTSAPKATTPVESSQFLNKDQVFKLSKLIFDAKINAKDIYDKYKVTSYEQLTNAQAKEIASDCQAKFLSV